MNRFDNVSVSGYSPQSFEELAFVPMLKRKKHDEILSQQELVRAGLAKVDPYDKHFEEAIRIKQDLESQLDKTAAELSQSGINNDMIGKTIALNRQYQNEISPTGRLGQINAEKQNILKINEEYDKLGQQKNWSQETTNYWKNKALQEYNQTPVYDDNGRILKYNGPQGIVNKVDYNKFLHDLATQAKMSTTEFAKAVTSLGIDEASGYNFANKNSYAHKLGDNYKAVKAAYDTLKLAMKDPTSEVYKSMQYEGRNPNTLINELNTQSGVYKQSIKSDEYGSDINPFGSGPDKKAEDTVVPTGVYDPASNQTVGGQIQDISFDQIGKSKSNAPIGSSPSVAGSGIGSMGYGKSGVQTYKDVISDPLQQKLYESSFRKLVSAGKLPKGIDINDKRVSSVVGTYMKNNLKVPTIGNDVIRPDVVPNGQLFMGELAGKAPADRNQTLTQDIQKGYRELIDDATGKKLEMPVGGTLEYVGFDSPVNYRTYKFGNTKEQSVMAHKVIVKDKDGNIINGTVSRTPQEIKSPQFKKAYEINHIYKNAVERFGEWVKPTGSYSGSKQVKGFEVKFNEDGTFQLRKGNLISDKMDAGRYAAEMNNILSDTQ